MVYQHPCSSAPWRSAHGRRDYRSNVEVLCPIMPEPLRAQDSHLQTMASVASERRSTEAGSSRKIFVRNLGRKQTRVDVCKEQAEETPSYNHRGRKQRFIICLHIRAAALVRVQEFRDYLLANLEAISTIFFSAINGIHIWNMQGHSTFIYYDYSDLCEGYGTSIVRIWAMDFAWRRAILNAETTSAFATFGS